MIWYNYISDPCLCLRVFPNILYPAAIFIPVLNLCPSNRNIFFFFFLIFELLFLLKFKHDLTDHGCSKFQLWFLFLPHATSKRKWKIRYPVILPYRYAKHNTYKAVSIQIIGTIMCGMVKEFWNILKPSAAENFLRRKNCYSFCNSGKTFI